MRTRIVRRQIAAPRTAKLKRKSFFVSEADVRRARKALGARNDGETVRLALQQAAEMASFRRFVEKTAGSLPPGSFEPI